MDRVIRAFGVLEAARLVALTPGAVRKWNERGGLIPSQHQPVYLAEAAKRGLKLSARDLIAEVGR